MAEYETTFVRFTEVNDWEGETWNFWLQVEGNEQALDFLNRWLTEGQARIKYDFPYLLNLSDRVSESTVDTLIKYGDMGYMDQHNKVTGVLKTVANEEYDDLYKGGIRELFHD